MKYIPVEKLIKLVRNYQEGAKAALNPIDGDADYYKGKIDACENIQELITFLQQEQPEVDLDDVIENYILENFGERWDGCVPIGCFELDLMAEHFYELGLNARKEE